MSEEINLQLLLYRIRMDAERRMSNPKVSESDAYAEAVVQVLTVAAKEQVVTPFEAEVLATMRQLGSPLVSVKKGPIARELHERGMGIDDFALWKSLNTLEGRGLVYRPKGPRSKHWTVAA